MLVLIHKRPRRTPWVSSSAMQVAHGAVGRTANPLKKKTLLKPITPPISNPFLAFYLSPIPSPNPIRKSIFHEKKGNLQMSQADQSFFFVLQKRLFHAPSSSLSLKGVLFDVSVRALCTIHPMDPSWGKEMSPKFLSRAFLRRLLAGFETFKRRVCK